MPAVFAGNRMAQLFGVALTIRLLSVLLVQTYFVPDEYWQSLEVAHRHTFGYGFLTWEWTEKIRGFLYPGLFALVYQLLELFHLDSNIWLFTNSPRILQAAVTAMSDVRLHMMACRTFGKDVANLTCILQLSSWFVFYVGSRTLTNTMEMALTVIGLSYLPIGNQRGSDSAAGILKASFYGALAAVIRPTAIITWFPVFVWTLFNICLAHLKGAVVIVLTVCLASTAIDSYFYKQLVIVPLRFFQFNVLRNIAVLYGTHDWHWYITQGLPVIGLPQLLLLIPAVCRHRRSHGWLYPAIVFVSLIAYSTQSHKEFRFVLPLLPILHCYCSLGLTWFSKESAANACLSVEKPQLSPFAASIGLLSRTGKLIVGSIVVVNAAVSVYFGVFHQAGAVKVMSYLQQQSSEEVDILYLMPCHSTPFYSHIHRPISMRQLDCSPGNTTGYVEEAAAFYNDPNKWLVQQFAAEAPPTHIVLFDVMVQVIEKWLKSNSYTLCAKFPHTHFPEGRIGSTVLVFCHNAS